ncbi:hypothetical protein ACSAZL_12505 [Methanosarcina sp. T3]|uniref:hypothetical protein n=1 Tax=Methanosarcina sp. T3 TaxID=3439062 RepID=UPI003F85732F
MSKKYYGERSNVTDPKINFNILKDYFFAIYKEYEEHMTLYNHHNPDIYIYGLTKMMNIWPIENCISSYDEVKLFTVIELLYDHIRVYILGSTYPFEKISVEKEETRKKKKEYITEINIILRHYNEGYELSEEGQIQKLSPPGFESLIEENIETIDPKNIDLRVKYAISKFSRYNSSVEEKKEAIRILADVLEYLGKFGIKLNNKDDSDLFKIINGFDIRHHNRTQQSDYNRDVWYDWMFYTFLASIHVLLKLNDEKLDLKVQRTA